MKLTLVLLFTVLLEPFAMLRADEFVIRDAASLGAALRAAKPGAMLRISPGEYPGDHFVAGVERLTIEALDAKQPPVFKGGKVGFHFSRCSGLTLKHLRLSGQSEMGSISTTAATSRIRFRILCSIT